MKHTLSCDSLGLGGTVSYQRRQLGMSPEEFYTEDKR